MTSQQLDDVLKVWKTRLSAIAENLLELQCDATYQSLTGTGGLEQVELTGETAARVDPALKLMRVLFQQFGLLQSTVDRAEALRANLPAVFSAEAKLREIEQLLFTPSIELETADVPLAERQLLSGAQLSYRVSPEDLLQTMMQMFTQVRDAVSVAEQAWTEFGGFSDRVDLEIARLRGQTALPSCLVAPALDDVEARLAQARVRASTDPIGAATAVRLQVEPALASAAQRIAAAHRVGQELRSARSRWELLERVHREAVALAEDVRARFTEDGLSAKLVPEFKLQAAGEWLARLEHKCEDGALEAVSVGLRNWVAAAEACLAQDRAVLQGCQAQMASRGELRGRLGALKAKANAYGLAEAGELQALSGDAEQLLYARPVDLQRAAAAVAQFEHRLRAARSVRGPERSLEPR